MKKNKIRRKLLSNYLFYCTEGPFVLLSLFYRIGLIQRSELEILCSSLLDTPLFEKKISEFLGSEGTDTSYFHEKMEDEELDEDYDNMRYYHRKPEKQKAILHSEEDETLEHAPETDLDDLILCRNDKEEFRIFKQVCSKMQQDGFLNGVDLPAALKVATFFSSTMAIKATELKLFNFDDESFFTLKNEIESYHVPISQLSLEEKIAWLSFCVAKASDDIQANCILENANMLKTDLTSLLSGIPEFFYNKKLEQLNYTMIHQQDEDKRILLKKYVASRLRSSFIEHVLPLEKHLQITKAMYYLERISFDDEKSFLHAARPLIAEALHGMPLDLKKEYVSNFLQDRQVVALETQNLKKGYSWIFDMVNYISRCFEVLNPKKMITEDEMLLKLSDLSRLANISIGMNPEWSMDEKDVFWDVVASMQIKKAPASISKYKTLQKFSKKGRSRD